MPKIKLKNKKVILMGLGLLGGGLGTALWLAKSGADLLVTDLKTRAQLKDSLRPLRKFKKIKYVLGRHRKSDFQSADLIIKNPAVSQDSPYLKLANQNKIPVETDISLFFTLNKGLVIGVTGSKGKSTTATLIYQIFQQAKRSAVLAGNIRLTPLSCLNRITNRTAVILELSSWQLNSLKKHKVSPYISVVTNIFPEHLNRYKNYRQYIADKKIILQNQTKSDFAILNYDNPETRKFGREVISQRFWFTKKNLKDQNGCFIKNDSIYFRTAGKIEKIIELRKIQIKGKHNLENILAAVCAARIYGLNKKCIQAVLANFCGLKDRLELIKIKRRVQYFNDTTATHPQATIGALDSFKQKVILIAGGADKKLNFQNLAKKIKTRTKFLILLEGDATDKLIKELVKIKFNKLAIVNNMKSAVLAARFMAVPDDIVLLSPAAASFNLFINEFDRGDQFKQCVRDLK